MDVLYFIKYFEHGFDRYFRKISKTDATIVFDLEDSIQDTDHPERNPIVKAQFRKILGNLLLEHKALLDPKKIGIRLNGTDSGEFERDIQFLQKTPKVSWDSIIIPKVEELTQLEDVVNMLHTNGILYNKLAIIAETEKGLKNLKQIVNGGPSNLKYVIFGHADYNIDTRRFPFIQHNDPEFWNWVVQVQRSLSGTGVTYINSPCLFLADDELFKFVLQKLYRGGEVPYGQMTLNQRQTDLCFNYDPRTESRIAVSSCSKDPQAHAKHIIKSLELRESDKGFAIDKSRYLMSPHEILMAKEILGLNSGE